MTTRPLREIEAVAVSMIRGNLVCESGHKPGQEHVHFERVHHAGSTIARALPALRAALAAQPEPLDVERLARAMGAVFERGPDADLDCVSDERQPEYARRVAAEYARLSEEPR